MSYEFLKLYILNLNVQKATALKNTILERYLTQDFVKQMWIAKHMKGEYDRYASGSVPLTLSDCVGKDLVSWSMVGNTVQDGTPSPDNVVDVLGTGDKTGNLYPFGDITVSGNSAYNKSQTDYMYITAGTYYLNTTFEQKAKVTTIAVVVRKKDVSGNFVVYYANTKSGTKGISFTIDEDCYIYFMLFSNNTSSTDYTECEFTNIVLNEGTTALPYEPYGYKIPVVTRGKNLCPPLTNGVSLNFATGEERASATNATSDYFKVLFPNTETRLTISGLGDVASNCIFAYDSNYTFVGRCGTATSDTRYLNRNFFVTGSGTKEVEKIKYIRVFYNGNVTDDTKIMCVSYEGSSEIHPPYEPYTEPTTTNIYLNSPLMQGETITSDGEREVEIGNYVITGEEVFKKDQNYATPCDYCYMSPSQAIPSDYINTVFVTHFTEKPSVSQINQTEGYYKAKTVLCFSLLKTLTGITDDDDANTRVFKMQTWFKNQYANGTPVTVWYQLATHTTETFTPPTIPTQSGTTVLDTDCVVAPSSVTAQYKSSKPDNTLTAMMNILSEV